MNLEEQFRTVL